MNDQKALNTMNNKFDLPGDNQHYIENMDEGEFLQFFTLCCKFCISQDLRRVKHLVCDLTATDNEIMEYLLFLVENFNEAIYDIPMRRAAVTGMINRKQSKRGLSRRKKLVYRLSRDAEAKCRRLFMTEKEQNECRKEGIKLFYKKCRYKYLTFPPSIISGSKYDDLMQRDFLTEEEKDELKAVYEMVEGGRYSSKGRIRKDNFMKISEIMSKEKNDL